MQLDAPSSAGTIQSVDRALQLLWELDDAPGLTLTVLAQRVGLLPTTAGRLLTTLEQHRLVERDRETRRFRLGLGLLELADRVRSRLDLRSRLEPLVCRLAETVEERVALTVLYEREVVHLLDVEGSAAAGHEVVLRSREGKREMDLNATAAGKVLLASLPQADREHLIAHLPLTHCTANTIVDPALLREHLLRVREQGYARNDEEFSPHVRGMAAPIRDHLGSVTAALAVHGPSVRFADDRMAQALPLLLTAAQEASALLGYREPRDIVSPVRPAADESGEPKMR
jgi:DNA-binding IclR family transcriptional regulator